MKRLFLLISLLVAAMALVPARAHASSFPITVVDDQGNRVRITHEPRRIITLFADYTEIVFALGLEKRLVGDASHYAEGATGIVNAAGKPRDFKYPSEWPSKWGRDYPVKSIALPHVEGGFGGTPFNLETIESLRPDLILAPYYASQVPVYQKMKELGFTVLFLNPSNIPGVLHDITLVGEATGARTHAAKLVGTLKSDLDVVRKAVARVHSRPRVYYEIDDSTPTAPITAGPGTVVNAAIRLAGGTNIASGASCSGTGCYPSFSLEALVQLNPQYIVLADAAYGVAPGSVPSRAGWSTIAAVRQHHIYAMDPDLLSRFGPRIVIGVHAMAAIIHPGIFRR